MVTFGDVTITSELNADPLTFNVTCTSVDGPVTSVAWTVDGSPVPSENNPITTRTVDDTETGAYTLTLSVTGRLTGIYNCTCSDKCETRLCTVFTWHVHHFSRDDGIR